LSASISPLSCRVLALLIWYYPLSHTPLLAVSYAHIGAYTHTHSCTRAHTRVHTYTHTYAHTHTCILQRDVFSLAYSRTSQNTKIASVHVFLRTHTHALARTHVYTCPRPHIHKHVHTQTKAHTLPHPPLPRTHAYRSN